MNGDKCNCLVKRHPHFTHRTGKLTQEDICGRDLWLRLEKLEVLLYHALSQSCGMCAIRLFNNTGDVSVNFDFVVCTRVPCFITFDGALVTCFSDVLPEISQEGWDISSAPCVRSDVHIVNLLVMLASNLCLELLSFVSTIG